MLSKRFTTKRVEWTTDAIIRLICDRTIPYICTLSVVALPDSYVHFTNSWK